MSEQVTKRQRVAAAKRAAIIGSPQFQEWWRWRKTFSPVPSEPYRAFMIDLGLYARVHHKEVWKFRTNRMDYPPIDLPKGVPSPKRRLPPRKQIKRFKPVPKAAQPVTLVPFEKELIGEVEKFREKFHLPEVEVRFEPRARAKHIPSLFGTPMIVMPKLKKEPKHIGRKQKFTAVIFHEAGHFAHAAYGGIGRIEPVQKAEELQKVITSPYVLGGTRAERIKKERIAWAIAKKGKKPWKPVMGWEKKYAFGTYLGTTPYPTFIEEKKRR